MTAADDIIKRAITILTDGAVQHPWKHGPFCPWCALADAKGQLEDERALIWIAYDDALRWAAWQLGKHEMRPLSQTEAIERLRAIAHNEP